MNDAALILRLRYDGAVLCDGCGAADGMDAYAGATPGGVADDLLGAGWRANDELCYCPDCAKRESLQ